MLLKELRNVPVDRFQNLYSIIHSFQADTKKSDNVGKEILSFAGSLGDLPENDYDDFIRQTKQVRTDLFDRDINL